MTNINRLRTAWKALLELGPGPLTQYSLYQISLRSGFLRWKTPAGRDPSDQDYSTTPSHQPLISLPDPDPLRQVFGNQTQGLLAEADEICEGQVRLFGGGPRPLDLIPESPLDHWTRFKHQTSADTPEDIKLIWEPGRFGWAVILARAYHYSGEVRYAQAFWTHTETFLKANPPNLGPHWVSAQEVALRLIALAFARQVFQDSSETTPARQDLLLRALAEHARRIPPSLAYARAQENNHLLSEAAGLYTAGLALPGHPEASRWRALGWRWFHQGLQDQIAPDGSYVQQSASYHRLMLQLALWFAALAQAVGESFPPETHHRLAQATRWLNALVDPAGGETPNLGPNDGAHILPLAACAHLDFRPTLAAAGAAFLGQSLYPPGPWDEPTLWLGRPQVATSQLAEETPPKNPAVLRNPVSDSWGYLRAARFTHRPGHADQLHFDLWWRGFNVALDPGTFHYNAAPPWENALSGTDVHNTITINGQDQMTRAGRFLWLDWAQARLAPAESTVAAVHNGYRQFKVIHKRSVTALEDGGWSVKDEILPANPNAGSSVQIHARLHWLLPDWAWEIQAGETGVELTLQGPPGRVRLAVQTGAGASPEVTLTRAGERIYGTGGIQPYWGWRAPTYAHKIPALSLGIAYTGSAPFGFTTEWHLESKN